VAWVARPFDLEKGAIVWCRHSDRKYDVGTFFSPDDDSEVDVVSDCASNRELHDWVPHADSTIGGDKCLKLKFEFAVDRHDTSTCDADQMAKPPLNINPGGKPKSFLKGLRGHTV
jgi:hypothetical protein